MSEEQKPANINQEQPREAWFSSCTIIITSCTKSETIPKQFFMDNITNYLNLPENAKVLDLACGKRHSIFKPRV
jgi:hypothetical protein